MARVALCEVSGLLKDALDKLSGESGSEWAQRLKSALRKNDLLRRVTEITVGAVKKFVAADHFKVGNAGIVYLGEDFKANFLGKIEKGVKAQTLVVNRLEKSSLDKAIRDELGAEREETTLAHLFELLKKQSRGDSGHLPSSGWANVFYIRDIRGQIWAVHVSWDGFGRGWVIASSSVTDPNRWHDGCQVFSRK